MRIAVADVGLFDKAAYLLKFFDYQGIGFKNALSFKLACVFGKNAFFVDGAESLYIPFKAGVKVFLAVARGYMHYADAGVHSYEIGMDYRVKFMI